MSNKTNNNQIIEIDIDKLDDDLWDARQHSKYDETKEKISIEYLAKSIKEHKLRHPIEIAKQKPNGHYSIVDGRLRTRAHKQLGLTKIKCIITEETDEKELAKCTLTENQERLDLSQDDKIAGWIHSFKLEGYEPKQVLYYAKKMHNYGEKGIPDNFIRVIGNLRPFKDRKDAKVPAPNYVYQVFQTIVLLKPEVKEHIQKYRLDMDKRIMLTHTKLREHPQIQKDLIEKIVSLGRNKAYLFVAQQIRDLETGATYRSGKSYAFNENAREKIDTKLNIVKSSVEQYLELSNKINNILYLMTGKKIPRGEARYKTKQIDNSEYHRLDILKGLNENEILRLESDLDVLDDAVKSFLELIDKEVLKQ